MCKGKKGETHNTNTIGQLDRTDYSESGESTAVQCRAVQHRAMLSSTGTKINFISTVHTL